MDSNKSHVTNPAERAKNNRRQNLTKVYESKEWQDASDEFLIHRRFVFKGILRGEGLQVGEPGYLLGEYQYWFEAKRPCKWHEEVGIIVKVGTLAHHPYLESYKDGTYMDLYLSGCMVLCNSCHYSLHRGMVLCKRCGVHYHRVGADMCKPCWTELHPEVVLAKWIKEILRKLKKRLAADAAVVLRREWRASHPKVASAKPRKAMSQQTQDLRQLL